MGKKRNRIKSLEKIEFTDAGARGKAVGHAEDGRVVFVSNAIPGDVADVKARVKKGKFYEGKATHFHSLSNRRTEPKCIHFGVCGGCKWQFMNYEDQLHFKEKEVAQNLKRIGKVEVESHESILPAPSPYYYRNKMEFSFSDQAWISDEEIASGIEFEKKPALGFHAPGRWDKSIDLKECHLQAEPSNSIRLAVRDFALQEGMEFYNPKFQTGLLRTLMIRTSSTGGIMVLVQFKEKDSLAQEKLLNFIRTSFPEVTSIFYVINPKVNDSMADLDPILYHGDDHILEEMEDLKFRVGPKSFYQTNADQAYNLYKLVRDYAGLTGSELVYDLYTGTGTIAQFLAKKAKKVIGIEYVEEAIQDARVNMEMNGLSNLEFFAGDMKKVLNQEFIDDHGIPDVLVTDPPRDGMHKDVIYKILEAKPKRIVYVSCNSATQARDLEIMKDSYRVLKSKAVDMFPQTHHVENVVLMELK